MLNERTQANPRAQCSASWFNESISLPLEMHRLRVYARYAAMQIYTWPLYFERKMARSVACLHPTRTHNLARRELHPSHVKPQVLTL